MLDACVLTSRIMLGVREREGGLRSILICCEVLLASVADN